MLLFVQDVGPWVCFPETIHEFYAHLAELVGNILFVKPQSKSKVDFVFTNSFM